LFWRENLKGIDNIVVDHSDIVTPYILQALCIIHCGCSTGIEAYFLNTPSITYFPIYNKVYDYHPSVQLSLKANSKDDVLEMIRDLIKEKKIQVDVRGDAIDIVSNNSSKLACEKILDNIDTLELQKHPDLSGIKKQIQTMNILLYGWKSYLKIKSFFKDQLDSYLKINHQKYMRNPKWPGSTLEEVRQKVRIFGEVDSRLSGIKVEKLFDNLYYLHK